MIIVTSSSYKRFPFTLKRKAGVFKFLRFRKLHFRDGFSLMFNIFRTPFGREFEIAAKTEVQSLGV